MKPLNELNIAFIDSETTGLDENQHEIIEIGALIYSQKEDKIIDEWEVKIAPSHIETASPEALKINGYINNPGAYTTSLKSALIKFLIIIKDCTLLGQNISFDLRFLKKAMADCGMEPNFHRHRQLDLLALSWFAVKDTNIPRMSLEHLCNHFNVSNAGAHGALVDCHRAFGVYRSLMGFYKK